MTPFRRFLLMLALTAMWSPSFLFIKLALTDLPPLTVVMLRVSFAAIILYSMMRCNNIRLPKDLSFWVSSASMAMFASVIPFGLFCYAEQYIESALAAILNGCTPMFTMILAQMFLPSDRLTTQKAVGIGLSALGLLLLFAPNIVQGFSGTLMGTIAGALAAFSYAVSHIYAKKYISTQHPLVSASSQLISSAVIITPLAFIYESPMSLPFPSILAISGVAGLTLFGTILAFLIYYKLMTHAGPTAISTVACFFPVGGMILGFFFLGECFTLEAFFAAGLILTGLLTVNEVISFRKSQTISQAQ